MLSPSSSTYKKPVVPSEKNHRKRISGGGLLFVLPRVRVVRVRDRGVRGRYPGRANIAPVFTCTMASKESNERGMPPSRVSPLESLENVVYEHDLSVSLT